MLARFQTYVDNYKGALPDKSRNENEIKELTQGRNKKLEGLAEIESKDGVFVVVTKPEDTMVKVRRWLS